MQEFDRCSIVGKKKVQFVSFVYFAGGFAPSAEQAPHWLAAGYTCQRQALNWNSAKKSTS
jgi:hypothetical protein